MKTPELTKSNSEERKVVMRQKGTVGATVLLLCALVVVSQRPIFSKNLEGISCCSPDPAPPQSVSLVYHTVATTNGSVVYISEEYKRLVRPNLYITGQLLFGQGKMNAGVEGELHEKLEDSIVALGIGFKRYMGLSNLSGLWCGGSVSVARTATTLEVSSNEPESMTDLSGLLMGSIGYTAFLRERLAMEIALGLAWPSLYPKPGMPDDLYASPFFGLGLTFVL